MNQLRTEILIQLRQLGQATATDLSTRIRREAGIMTLAQFQEMVTQELDLLVAENLLCRNDAFYCLNLFKNGVKRQ